MVNYPPTGAFFLNCYRCMFQTWVTVVWYSNVWQLSSAYAYFLYWFPSFRDSYWQVGADFWALWCSCFRGWVNIEVKCVYLTRSLRECTAVYWKEAVERNNGWHVVSGYHQADETKSNQYEADAQSPYLSKRQSFSPSRSLSLDCFPFFPSCPSLPLQRTRKLRSGHPAREVAGE